VTTISLIAIFILLYIFYIDYTYFIIQNKSILTLFILKIISQFFFPENFIITTQIFFIIAILSFIAIIYCYGIIGGGDAKLLGMAFFWFPYTKWIDFYIYLTVLTLAISILALINLFPTQNKGKSKIMPFGPCISISWITMIVLNQI